MQKLELFFENYKIKSKLVIVITLFIIYPKCIKYLRYKE